jgi:hypothetical protein
VKTRLADIADIRTGFPFRTKVVPAADGTLAVVQMKDVDESAGLIPEKCVRIEDEPRLYQRHLLELGDVLLQSRGHKFPAVLFDKPLHAVAALGLVVIRPKGSVDSGYLCWVLNHPRIRDALRGVARGTYVPFLARADLEEIQVPVPPRETQGRLVEIDRLRRQEARLVALLADKSELFMDSTVWSAAESNKRT